MFRNVIVLQGKASQVNSKPSSLLVGSELYCDWSEDNINYYSKP